MLKTDPLRHSAQKQPAEYQKCYFTISTEGQSQVNVNGYRKQCVTFETNT